MATDPKDNNAGRRAGRGWVIILGLVLSGALAIINGLQLASLERALGGVAVPETRYLGYGVEQVEAVRAGMTDELLERYGAAHYLWDLLFPVVFAATLVLLALKVARGRKIFWLFAAVPVLYAVLDVAENIALEVLFASEAVTSEVVTFASALTVLKSLLFVLSVVTALLSLITRPRTKRQGSTP